MFPACLRLPLSFSALCPLHLNFTASLATLFLFCCYFLQFVLIFFFFSLLLCFNPMCMVPIRPECLPGRLFLASSSGSPHRSLHTGVIRTSRSRTDLCLFSFGYLLTQACPPVAWEHRVSFLTIQVSCVLSPIGGDRMRETQGLLSRPYHLKTELTELT